MSLSREQVGRGSKEKNRYLKIKRKLNKQGFHRFLRQNKAVRYLIDDGESIFTPPRQSYFKWV